MKNFKLRMDRTMKILFLLVLLFFTTCKVNVKDNSSAVNIFYTTTLKAIACNTDNSSNIASAIYTKPTIYTCASFYSTKGRLTGTEGYWKNGTWTALTPIDSTKSSSVYSMVISGTDVYAGGTFGNSDNVSSGYWSNGIWNALDNSNSGYLVTSIVVVP
jgi:hypothetical protein